MSEPPEQFVDGKGDFHGILAYRLAYVFSLAVYRYLDHANAPEPTLDPLHRELALHGLRIAADIAGGHGLGYEEDALCGNIVKNRWALGHAQTVRQLLEQLIAREGRHETLRVSALPSPTQLRWVPGLGRQPSLVNLQAQLPPIIRALEERIAELRAKVWWDK